MGEFVSYLWRSGILRHPARTVNLHFPAFRNGKTPGIIQPSVKGQEAVIQKAYRRAGLSTDETDYVEVSRRPGRGSNPKSMLPEIACL